MLQNDVGYSLHSPAKWFVTFGVIYPGFSSILCQRTCLPPVGHFSRYSFAFQLCRYIMLNVIFQITKKPDFFPHLERSSVTPLLFSSIDVIRWIREISCTILDFDGMRNVTSTLEERKLLNRTAKWQNNSTLRPQLNSVRLSVHLTFYAHDNFSVRRRAAQLQFSVLFFFSSSLMRWHIQAHTHTSTYGTPPISIPFSFCIHAAIQPFRSILCTWTNSCSSSSIFSFSKASTNEKKPIDNYL